MLLFLKEMQRVLLQYWMDDIIVILKVVSMQEKATVESVYRNVPGRQACFERIPSVITIGTVVYWETGEWNYKLKSSEVIIRLCGGKLAKWLTQAELLFAGLEGI
ncbi:hypothetical protein CS542_00885 [Pedobacter sp. IW39]|nr:hypothetical protein CS542_00885 [Pedobacter sp. IW39]